MSMRFSLMATAGYTHRFYGGGSRDAGRRQDWQGRSQWVSGRFNRNRVQDAPLPPHSRSRMPTMGFTLSDAGDKFLVGVSSNPPWNVLLQSHWDCCRGGNHWEHSPKLRRSDKLLAPKCTDILIRPREQSPSRAACCTIISLPLSVGASLPDDSEEEGSPASPSHMCLSHCRVISYECCPGYEKVPGEKGCPAGK